MKKNPDKYIYEERKRWVFLGLPFTFTVYRIGEDMLTTDTGFLNKTEDDCFMYKVQDAKLTASLGERMFGLGTIICYTGDVTDQKLEIKHVKNAKEIKDYILKTSEEARIKRRSVNVQNIGVDDCLIHDTDGLIDMM